ncbi:MAG: GNAT family N-acetyltransferase [Synergistaceae bacterium]|nr:GNAT family N-acetyltransferase [Synergistaceae bacterium]
MLDDDVRIRSAEPEESELLSDIAWRSKEYWEYPIEMMAKFRDFLTIRDEFIEKNPTYLAENEETGEILGFYSIELHDDHKWWIRHLWVVPEHIGTGVGGELFLHACEMAETVGADELNIITDPNVEEFYLHMGAEKIGEIIQRAGDLERRLPTLLIRLN